MSKRTVSKVFSPEEKTVLANIKSLVAQLEAMEGGETDDQLSQQADRPAEVVNSKDGKKKVRKEKVMDIQTIKQKVMNAEELSPEERLALIESLPKEDDPKGEEEVAMSKATASDNADERVADGNEETTDDAVAEVGENLKQIALSITNEVNKTLKKSLDSITDQISVNSQAIAGMLDGMGLTQEIQKAAETEESKKVQKSQPTMAVDLKQVLELVQGGVKKSEDEGSMVEPFSVRKSTASAESRRELGGAMSALFGGNSQSGRL